LTATKQIGFAHVRRLQAALFWRSPYNDPMSEGPAKPCWYQFTLARILGATFWMGVCFGLVALGNSSPEIKQTIETSGALFVCVIAATVLSPFIAIGTLLGRPFRGLLVGIVLVGGYALAVYIAIDNGWIGFP
jgi:hypothetical protein